MKNNWISIVLLFAIISIINILSDRFFFRLDLTEDKQYTLSQATKDILDQLDEPVTVKAYFSEELPPELVKVQDEFESMLVDFNRLSGGNVVFDFFNPNEDTEVEREANMAGVSPVMIGIREKDQIKQQKSYMGASFELGDQKEVIPFFQQGTPLEYTMATAIKKISVSNKPTIGIIQGHGEPGLDELAQVMAGLEILYTVEPYTLTDSVAIPPRFQTLALVRPTDSIPMPQLARLDEFLNRGGKLFVAMNRVEGDLQRSMGEALATGLESWLQQKGLLVEDAFITDASSGAVMVQQQQGMFRFNTQVQFPFLPVIKTFADHPLTKGLEAMVLQFASPIVYTGDTSHNFKPLAMSSEKSGKLQAPQFFNIQKQWTNADYPLSNQTVAALLEQNSPGKAQWKIILISDGDFPISGPRGQQIQPDNANFMINSIDWLSDETGLIDLRTKGIRYRPIDELEESTRILLKFTNFLLPIILLIVYGLVRMQMNRIKRLKRREMNYE